MARGIVTAAGESSSRRKPHAGLRAGLPGLLRIVSERSAGGRMSMEGRVGSLHAAAGGYGGNAAGALADVSRVGIRAGGSSFSRAAGGGRAGRGGGAGLL